MYYLCIVKLKIVTNMVKEITEQENDLIEAIRNYRKSYPNGKKELLYYAQVLFEELTDI